MRRVKRLAIGLLPLLLAACGDDVTPVDGPFYLTYLETRDQMALYRCPKGPNDGCAIDGLPDATVFAAGADKMYIVVARHPRVGGATNRQVTEYFYFARIPQEREGWGFNPEKIVGPLTQVQFDADKSRLHLPEFSVHLRDLD